MIFPQLKNNGSVHPCVATMLCQLTIMVNLGYPSVQCFPDTIVNNPLVVAPPSHKLSGVSVRISTLLDMSVSALNGHKLSGVSIGLYYFIKL